MFRSWSPVGACFLLHWGVLVRDLVPILVAVGLVAAVVVGGNGLEPRELGRICREQAGIRFGMVLGWAFLVRAATRRQLFPPGATWLRSSPVPPVIQWLVCSLFVLAAQALPAALLLIGGQPGEALTFALAAGTLACVGWERRSLGAIAVLSLVVLIPRGGLLPSLAPLPLLGVFFLVMVRAHRNATVQIRWRGIRAGRLPVIVHLILTYLRELMRGRAAALPESGAIAVGCTLWFANSLRDKPLTDRRSLLELAAVLAGLGSAPLLATVGRVRRMLLPWIRASQTPCTQALLAGILVLTTPSLAFAATIPLISHGTPTDGALAWAYALPICALLLRVEQKLQANGKRHVRALQVLCSVVVTLAFWGVAQAPLSWVAILGSSLFLGMLLMRESEGRRVEDP